MNMQPIVLSEPGAALVQLDPIKLIDTRLLIAADSGGGKSWALRLIAEQIGPQLPTYVIDPEGEWATLRSHVPAVLIGSPDSGADTRADPATAKQIAQRLLRMNCSAILDLSDLNIFDQQKFVQLFLDELLAAPKSLWRPRLVMVDEAHRFAPQDDKNAPSNRSMATLASAGRKRGLGCAFATQRFAKIDKNAIGGLDNRMLGRFAQDVDVDRAAQIVGMRSKDANTFRRLRKGEFVVLGSAFIPSETADPSAESVLFRTRSTTLTEHPEPGTRTKMAMVKPVGRIDELAAQLRDIDVAPAASDENAVRDVALEHECEDLRRQLERAEGLVVGLCVDLDTLRAKIRAFATATTAYLDDILSTADATPEPPATASAEPSLPTKVVPLPVVDVADLAALERRDHKPDNTGIGNGVARKLLVALLQLGKPVTRKRAALVAGISPRSSSFSLAITFLRNHEPPLIQLEGGKNGMLVATAAAKAILAGTFAPLPTGDALIAHWRAWLGSGSSGKLFAAIATHRGRPVPRAEAASTAGISIKSSSLSCSITELCDLGLVVRIGKLLALSPDLVPSRR